jgi:tetratricopeptide (TPR) repeat protein
MGQDLPQARAYLERGLRLLEGVPPELAGRFLNDAARVPWEEGRPEEAFGLLEEALKRLPEGSPYRVAPLTNLAFLRLKGDLEGRIRALEEVLARKEAAKVLALYQEPLFPGLDLPLLDRKREELYHRVRALFLEAGEPRYLERLLELDPLDEEALLPLAEGCLSRGQRARALRLLRAYEKRLWEELGERPSGEIAALLRRLQA